MFLRVDRDIYININNISSYKLSEDTNSYKLTIYGLSGNVLHNIIYLKDSVEQIGLLLEVNNILRERLINPDIIPQADPGDANG